ncbi:MAG: SGNH/GDSL hydrolase family protein [Candidatus Saccharimonadales bacterium]
MATKQTKSKQKTKSTAAKQKAATKAKRQATRATATPPKKALIKHYQPALILVTIALVFGVWFVGHQLLKNDQKTGATQTIASKPKPSKKSPAPAPKLTAKPLAEQKLAIIGDSQFTQNDTGLSNVPAAFISRGWKPENIWLYAVLAKSLNDPDVNGFTTVQNIADARAALGGEPDLWVFNLGGNGNDAPDEITQANMTEIFTALGPNAKVLWTSIARRNADDIHVNRRNEVTKAFLASYPHTRLLDWAHYVHTLDESQLWNIDGIHMTTDPGYAERNVYTSVQAAAYALEPPK